MSKSGVFSLNIYRPAELVSPYVTLNLFHGLIAYLLIRLLCDVETTLRQAQSDSSA